MVLPTGPVGGPVHLASAHRSCGQCCRRVGLCLLHHMLAQQGEQAEKRELSSQLTDLRQRMKH